MRISPRTAILLSLLCVGVSGPLFDTTVIAQLSHEGQSTPTKKTFIYKVVGDVEIRADVYLPNKLSNRPVLAWFHGGALMMGHRSDIPKQFLELGKKEGFVVVSFDYRLIPEAKLPDVIEDLKDAFDWIRTSGPELFNADPSKLVVSGGSAGGYLALMSGFAVNPPPTAIVSFWGFGDIDGKWTTTPNEAFLKSPLISDEDAWALVGDRVLTNVNKETGPGRWKFFIYLKQQGSWAKVATGYDPQTERDKFTPFCPIRNISANYPPTLFVHGTADIDVPYDKSVEMASELQRLGRPHRLITLKDGRHGGWGGDPKLVVKAIDDSMGFIRTHLSGP
jgi:acetyl esterase/lipase